MIPFEQRHIGPDAAETERMLRLLGLSSLEELADRVVPESIADRLDLALPPAITESELLAELRELADRNVAAVPMIGLGYHGTITPAVIRRNLLENPAWYTAYTPYQPEISQGRLEALLNFQTLVAELTGLPTANASLLDEATAAAEAMALALRAHPGTGRRFLIADDLHPQSRAVLATRAEAVGIELVAVDPTDPAAIDWDSAFGLLVQLPGTRGRLLDVAAVADAAHAAGALLIVAADPLSLLLLDAPGARGADVVVGSMQRFGVPMGCGGPHAAYLSVRAGLERQIPGRLVGVSVDAAGKPAYRLALQAREQHIRRDRATSNICTAQVLLAIVAAMYASYHGPAGLRAIAEHAHRAAVALATGLRAAGLAVGPESFFDTITVGVAGRAAQVVAAAAADGVDLRLIDADTVGITTDETTTDEHLQTVRSAFGVPGGPAIAEVAAEIPATLARIDEPLQHPVFHRYRSETAMMRYLRRLSDRDLALDRGMIPLGSCTMKLNAAAEMEPITWPRMADVHPYAPADRFAGTAALVADLERMLAEVTGYAAVSVQPNAGSQGEFAGLLAIRAYHRSRGDDARDVCLIPASAHGTNAASAVMAGMRVVVVSCDDRGDVDLADLRARLAEHAQQVAALMITYPSTHGVFEEAVAEICAAVHEVGGQVYVDGANLNAMVGLARPGRFGADVSHLNLHKTFCIPHGGGGPGVGPVAVAAHLAPFLPGHPLDDAAPVGPVSAAPFGSALVLPISWAYLRLMGPAGLRRATATAILSANYVAARLQQHYPVLYSGATGLVAHECILDLRPLTKETGVTVEDVAKRLMDYGFHAPTMAFPVAGTLMVEPTESEDLAEVERFCEAMIAIRGEIERIATGEWALADSPLRLAPHTAADLAGEWGRRYSRALGGLPAGDVDKYWPPVGRIDQAYGDRNLMCSCVPVTEYA